MAARRTREMVVRLWRIVELVQARRRGLTVGALVEALEVSRATVYRDLRALEESGAPLFRETINGEVRYALDRDPLPALRPTTMQLAALCLAREALAPLEGSSIVAELDALLRLRRRGTAPTRVRAVSRAGRAHPAVVEAVYRALGRGRRLRIRYRAASTRRTTWRCVDPVALRIVDEQLYLIAWDADRDDWRTFKMARVLFAEQLDEQTGAHPDLDEARLFEHAVRIWDGDLVDVAIRIDAEVAWLVGEWPLHPEQRVEQASGGDVIVRARVAGIVESLRWVLRWGRAAEVVEPSSLRHAVREELESALSRYGPAAARRAKRRVSGNVRRASATHEAAPVSVKAAPRRR